VNDQGKKRRCLQDKGKRVRPGEEGKNCVSEEHGWKEEFKERKE
jgi:hypothetical protein